MESEQDDNIEDEVKIINEVILVPECSWKHEKGKGKVI